MNKVTGSSLLLVAQKVVERSLGVVSTLILARILTPEDFGIIAAAMLVLWFVKTITRAGTESYIIQKESVSVAELNSAWTLDFILKLSAYILLICSAPFVAKFQNIPELFNVIVGIASMLLIAALGNPGLLLFKREQNYKKIVQRDVFVKMIAIALTIPMAIFLQNYWAIVIGQVGSSLVGCLLSYQISSYRPKFCFYHIKEQWNFSKWLIPQAVLGYFRNHIDTLIVGVRYDASSLGAYNNMKYFSSIPMLQFITPLMAPLHAELGKVQHQTSEMKFQCDVIMKLLGFIVAPIVAIFYVLSENIVFLVLGEQWVIYHEIFGALGLMTVPFVLFTQASRMLMIALKTRLIFLYELISSTSVCLFLVFLTQVSITEFALYKVAAEMLLSTAYYFYAYQIVFGRIPILNYTVLLIPSIISSVLAFEASLIDFHNNNSFYELFAVSCLVGISVIILLVLFYLFVAHPREKKFILKLVRDFRR